MHADSIDSGKVELHRCIVIITLEPTIQESPVNLLNLNDEQVIDVLMHNKLGERVLILTMCVAEADLLVVILIETNRCVVKVLNEVLKLDPEDTIHLIIQSNLFL